jgi:hypothetical protein
MTLVQAQCETFHLFGRLPMNSQTALTCFAKPSKASGAEQSFFFPTFGAFGTNEQFSH